MKLLMLFVLLSFNIISFNKIFAQPNQIAEKFAQTHINNIYPEVVLETGYLIDSVTTTSPNGVIGKSIFEYNENGNLILTIRGVWNGVSLIDSSRNIYAYNSKGKMLSDLQQRLDGLNWVNVSWRSYYYDSNNNLISYKFSSGWDGKDWESVSQRFYSYDANGAIISEIYQRWDGIRWLDIERWLFEYDINGYLIEKLKENWIGNYLFGNWHLNSREFFTYDSNGNNLSHLIELFLENITIRVRYTYTYNDNGNILSYLKESSYFEYWTTESRISYTYNSDEMILSSLSENYVDNFWKPSSKDTYTYNMNGHLTELLRQDWDENNWINYDIEKYLYDSNGNILLFIYDRLVEGNIITINRTGKLNISDKFGNIFVFNGVKVELFYSSITDVEAENIISNYSLNQNFPNPFNPVTSINYTIPNSEFVSIKVFDIIGNEVAVLVNEQKNHGSYQVKFDASNLSSGVYIYRIQAGSFNQVRKMMLIK